MSLLFRWAQRCCFVSFCAGSGGGGIYVCLVTCLTSAKYKHACTRTHVCMHAHTRTHMHACTHTDTHAHAHMHARTHITLICTHARTHAHTHTHTHITSSHLHLLPPPPPLHTSQNSLHCHTWQIYEKVALHLLGFFFVVAGSIRHATCKTLFTLHPIFCAQHTWCSFDVDI